MRTEGRNAEADTVYKKRRKRQHEQLNELLPKYIDCIFDKLSHYGTDNSIMLKWSFGIWLVSACLFVTPISSFKIEKEKEKEIQKYEFVWAKGPIFELICSENYTEQKPVVDNLDQSKQLCFVKELPKSISYALLISLEQFLPFKLPIVKEYQPANFNTSLIASIEKIAGWIFIPLLIANISGFLNNKAKPQA